MSNATNYAAPHMAASSLRAPGEVIQPLRSVLVVAEGEPEDAGALAKAAMLARHSGAIL
jgi:hypothetical protein